MRGTVLADRSGIHGAARALDDGMGQQLAARRTQAHGSVRRSTPDRARSVAHLPSGRTGVGVGNRPRRTSSTFSGRDGVSYPPFVSLPSWLAPSEKSGSPCRASRHDERSPLTTESSRSSLVFCPYRLTHSTLSMQHEGVSKAGNPSTPHYGRSYPTTTEDQRSDRAHKQHHDPKTPFGDSRNGVPALL